jgi:cysteine-rich repeat protein
MRMLWFGVLAMASCVRTSTLTCGELTCEAGSVCSPSGTACTTQAQIDECFDADTPAATCTAPEGRAGVCRDGYCQEIRCGDERVDPGEMCDDGNFASGDACSPDCLSDESCGNNVIDRGLEECDDGNIGAHDGCNATCKTESPIWRQLIDTSFPPRVSHSMVYDVARKRVVLFGGRTGAFGGSLSNDTWEFDGLAWTLRTTATSPSPREQVALAYDATRQRTVLFGGVNNTGLLDDTWEWDGTSWTQKTPTAKPSPRSGANAVFHPGRAVVVLYGGAATGSTASDTWEYNGTNWVNQTGAGTPGKSVLQPMSYDPVAGGIVLFGGDVAGKTWRYNGTWTELPTSSAPPRSRGGFVMTFDASTNHTVMIGGSGGECGASTLCSDAFELVDNGSGTGTFMWSNVGAEFAPLWGAAAYDVDTSQLVVMGGQLPGTGNAAEPATWTRTAGAWTKLELPSPRNDCQLAYLPALNGTVLFGGMVGTSNARADTWLLRDGVWRPLPSSSSPAATAQRAMALDRARNKLVLVDSLGETWELGASGWTKVITATSPPPRSEFGLVYDDARAAVVLHGGYDPSKVVLSDTWTYDGTNWTQLVTTAPPARREFAMSYDRARDRIVVFGGATTGVPDATTWELSGTTWTMATATGPTARSQTPMAYDPKRASSVMFGGNALGNVPNNETWEYVDGAWRQSSTAAPPARASHCSTYDETLEKVVVVGGVRSLGAPVSETWLFGYE